MLLHNLAVEYQGSACVAHALGEAMSTFETETQLPALDGLWEGGAAV